MKPVINFIFSIGYRCYSTKFLKDYKLRKISSPFDYLFVDIETSLKIINNKFEDYLHDIILYNKADNTLELFYNKKTTEINKKFYKLVENNITYMSDNYKDRRLIFNQNYLDTLLSNNLYEWNTICSFHHHDITKTDMYNKIKKRCDMFIEYNIKK